MTDLDPQSRLAALAALPPGHPERSQFNAELAALDPAQREHWLAVQHESDLLHDAFSSAPAMPKTLEQKLLALPTTLPIKHSFPYKRLLIAAAAVLIIVPVALFFLNRAPETDNTAAHIPTPLAAQTATDIADLAVKIHQTPPPLTIVSADPVAVAAALKDNHMPFPTILMKPTEPLTLVGGGICDFGPTRAIFTRWKSPPSTTTPILTYTLYQFDGAPLHVQANFQRQTATPSSAAQTLRVALWPGNGNPCTWALVLENPDKPAPFYY